VVFAHNGRVTWDEWLFVLVPLALFAVVIWRAKLRAEREHKRDHRPSDP
jgi:hypothetical protein